MPDLFARNGSGFLGLHCVFKLRAVTSAGGWCSYERCPENVTRFSTKA
jgi:hypothetical protein